MTTRLLTAVFLTTLTLGATLQGPGARGEDQPQFTEAFLNDPANLALGQELWVEQCQHCHGKNAYPGKAPKLKPRRYDADFVYDRITNGFRKMPAWDEVYDEYERMSITAWVMNKSFSP